jgi:DNA polymerase-3 subunit delta
MPRSPAKSTAPVLLVCGEDEFAVKQQARQTYSDWSQELGGMDHEIIDASVSNSGEALKALGRLRESLQTLPFFGDGKVIWLQNCNFLGDERTASASAVTETLAELAQELKDFAFEKVRLLISASKVDKRKAFYKAIDKLGTVLLLEGWSSDEKDWAIQAEDWATKKIQSRGKTIDDEALGELVNRVGPNARQLDGEVEKLCLYVGERAEIGVQDVTTICSRNKTARAFALGDALGNRNLPELLQRLDEELWEVRLDPKRSEIGLLYGLISKVRSMILLKEMMREGWVKPVGQYGSFKTQLDRVPREQLPADRRFNPLSINPFVLFKAMPHAQRYSQEELVRAMELLLRCNHLLVSSNLDEALVLQQTLVQIVGSAPAGARAEPSVRGSANARSF